MDGLHSRRCCPNQDTRNLKLGHSTWNLLRAGDLYSPALGYSNAAGGGPDGIPLSPVGCLN